jgi:Uma2 family endonuclease
MTQTPLRSVTNPVLNPELQDRFLVYSGITWEQFKLIQAGFANSTGVRLFYYKGTIEIFMPGYAHEFNKTIIGFLVELFCFNSNIEFFPMGSMTQQKEGEVSAEPDESYCFNSLKLVPDLVVEVIITSGSPKKLERYQALEIPEVWFWQNGEFSLYHLQSQGYELISQSLIPEIAALDIELLTRCVLIAQDSRLEAAKTFRDGIKLI